MEQWRRGQTGHFLLYSVVRTRSSTNGVGTGFTTSGNPGNLRWSFPVCEKVTLDVLISCWTYGMVRAYMRDVLLSSLYLPAQEFCPKTGGQCNGVVKHAWLGLPDGHVRCPVPGNRQPYIHIATET